MSDIVPPPPSATRRDRKAQAAPGLVAAAPVHSARVVGATGARRGWLIGGGIAVAIVLAFSGAMIATSGSGGAELPALNEAQDLRAADHLELACPLPAAGEASGAVANLEACDEADESGDFLDPITDSQEADARPGPRASGQPHAPDDTNSGPVTPNVPGSSAPTPGAPTDPGTSEPAPSNPSPGPAPAPSQPAPEPSTPAPKPAPSDPPPPVHVPEPLAFTGLESHSLLGILLSSYTLSLSGEPGSTATVWYGSNRAGNVQFNSNGHASISIGGSLINLGGNPIIRVAYSDGTSGSEIQARRDSI